MISTGRFFQRSDAPLVTASSAIGFPAAKPYDMQALMMPQNVATQTPFLKLNSLTVAVFSFSGTSRSFPTPANPLMTIPTKQTTTPPITTRPEVVLMTEPNAPSTIGGSNVPKAAQ